MPASPFANPLSRRQLFQASTFSSLALASALLVPTVSSTPRTEGGPVYNVLDYGAKGDGVTDDTAALSVAIAAAKNGGNLLFPEGRTYRISGTLDLSQIQAELTLNLERGAVICQYANLPALFGSGSLGSAYSAGDIGESSTTLTMPGEPAFSTESLVYIASKDTISGTTDKLGYMRRVVGMSGSIVSVDRAVPRQMRAAILRIVRLLPRVNIIGGGQIRHVDCSNTKPLVNLTLCNSPTVNIELGPSGATGVLFAHCWGGQFAGYVHDLTDDPNTGHFGYGVEVAGTTRNFRVSGKGVRCRHAFTTNVGPDIPNSAFYGEPEDIAVNMATEACSNKALDTHRAGWGVTFYVNDIGSTGGAVQIRADNTTVIGGTIKNTYCYGIAVSPLVRVAARINDLSIDNMRGYPGRGLELLGPAIVRGLRIAGFTTAGIRVAAPNCTLSDVSIDGLTSAPGITGIDILGSGTRIRGGNIYRVGTGIRLSDALVDCSWKNVVFNSTTITPVLHTS